MWFNLYYWNQNNLYIWKLQVILLYHNSIKILFKKALVLYGAILIGKEETSSVTVYD